MGVVCVACGFIKSCQVIFAITTDSVVLRASELRDSPRSRCRALMFPSQPARSPILKTAELLTMNETGFCTPGKRAHMVERGFKFNTGRRAL